MQTVSLKAPRSRARSAREVQVEWKQARIMGEKYYCCVESCTVEPLYLITWGLSKVVLILGWSQWWELAHHSPLWMIRLLQTHRCAYCTRWIIKIVFKKQADTVGKFTLSISMSTGPCALVFVLSFWTVMSQKQWKPHDPKTSLKPPTEASQKYF